MRNTLISVLITSAVLSSGVSFAQDNVAASPDNILLGAEGEEVVSSVDRVETQSHFPNSEPGLSVESLADSISAAYQRNPSVLAQRKVRMIADERLSQARALKRPQVSVSSSAGYAISRNGQTSFADFEAPQTTFGLEVRQSIWNGGRNDAAIGEAAAGVTQAESQLFAFEQDMILNVVTNYMDVLATEAEVDIRKNDVKVLARQVEAASARFEVGEVTRTDVAQAQARYSGAKAQLSTAQANLVANRAVFQELVGRWPGQLQEVSFTPEYPKGLDDAVSAAMEYNPELVASKASVKASEQRLRSAKGQNRPDISVIGAAGLGQTYQDDTFSNENASVVAQLTLPLYTGGRISSQIRSAALERDQLRLQHRAAERNVLVQVTRAWHSALASQRTIEASQQQVKAAQTAFDGAEQELAVGLRTTLDLLDQEQELLDAQLALVQANRTHYIAVHQLLAAMGALTPESLGVNLSL